jgi:cyclin-dependent kinase 17
MGSGRPLFPGATVEEELELIVRSLGLPPAEATPSAMHTFLEGRKQESPRPLLAPRLDAAAFDLLPKFLTVSLLL